MEKLGKYLILGELGRGAGGIVYRARDPIINRLVALKTITTGLAEFPDLLQRFYQEAQSAGGLQHPNIVTIFDMGDENGIPYIAMELVEGESLDQVIARRANLPVPLKLTYALQACRAFDYAHKRGIIHRDIKPDNVMLSKDGTVKVVDFGIARVLETSKTQTGMLLGTFAYMSPEQYHGEHADARSDIWSFGILFYELLAYQRPFRGPTPASLMHSICQLEPTPLLEVVPECPAGIEKIIQKILRKSAADRYQTMEELLLDLDPICRSLQAESVAGLVAESRQLVEEGDYSRSRDMLRQALQIDSSNTQARNLLEKVNLELRRILVRPKAQQHVEKGLGFLAEKKIQEAKLEAESALQLDSSFASAQELQKQIQAEIDRTRMVAEWLEASRQRLAEGLPDDADELLAKVLGVEPTNEPALALQKLVIKEKEEQQRRRRLIERMQAARSLWTQQNYAECIHLLTELQTEFPGEDEIPRLLETAREDQATQKRAQGLVEARGLLANRRYDDCKKLLAELGKQFPNEEEIPKLQERVIEDEAKQRRLKSLAEARNLWAARRYDDCLALLSSLQKEFPDEEEIPKLRDTVLEDQAKQRRLQSLAEARNLLAARRYDECQTLLASLQKEFSADNEIAKLNKQLLDDRAKQKRVQTLAEARSHLAARRFDECLTLLTAFQKEFPQDDEVSQLLGTAREEKAEQLRQQGVARARKLLASRQYDECRVLLSELQEQFPNDDEVPRLLEAVRKEEAEQQRLKGLTEAQDLLASRQHAACAALLLNLQKQFSNDEEIAKLLDEVRKDEAEQNKLKFLAEARALLAARRYEETIVLLVKLEGQYPGDNDISKLLETAREHQAEELKLQGMADIRNLLATRRYDDSIALLVQLQKKFPGEEEIARLLETAGEDRAEQEKQKKLAEARSHLAAQRFSEALGLLEKLGEAHPKDSGIHKLKSLALQEQEKQASQERLQKKLKAVKKLVNEKKYAEVLADAGKIQSEFPGDADLARLVEFARGQQTQLEQEQRLRQTLDEIKGLIATNRFEEAYQAALNGLKTFPGNQEMLALREQADTQQRKLETRQHIEQRIREIKVKINRGKISEAIDLANETLVTMGPDTDVTQLLNSARVEYEAREKKRDQEGKLEAVRALIAAGKLGEASKALDNAVDEKILELFDPRVQRVCDEIEAAKTAAASALAGTQTSAVSLSKEYAWLQGPPVPEAPDLHESHSIDQPEAKASAAQPSLPAVNPPAPKVSPVPPLTPTQRIEPPSMETARRTSTAPAIPVPPTEIQKRVPSESPAIPTAGDQTVPRSFIRRPAILAAVALGTIGLIWAAVRVLPLMIPKGTSPASATKVTLAKPQENPLETRQKAAMDAADKLVAANDLEGALITLEQAMALNGPLSAEIQTKLSGIKEAMQNQSLRTLRQKEEQLWQQAKADVAVGRFREAEKGLQQILALGDGGLRKNDARQYLAKTIPARQEEEKLFTQAQRAAEKEDLNSLQSAADLLGKVIAVDGQRKPEAEKLQHDVRRKIAGTLTNGAHQDLQRGDFRSARLKAMQMRQNDSDAGPLLGEIDQAEQTRFVQLESQFNQLKQSDDDAAAQQLGALQRGLQALADSSGPRAEDAKNILNNLPAAILDVHDRAANKQAQGLQAQQQQRQYQQAVQTYNGIDGRDKNALEKSRNDFRAIVNGNGPHVGDAQQYLAEINKKLDDLNTPPQLPPSAPKETPNTGVADEAAIRTVIQSFFQSWEQRSPDALRQSWPSIPQKRYDAYKSSFDNVSAITIKIVSESVKINPDGATATVSVQSQEEQTPKGEKKPRKFAPTWTFQLAKRNGTWLITDVL